MGSAAPWFLVPKSSQSYFSSPSSRLSHTSGANFLKFVSSTYPYPSPSLRTTLNDHVRPPYLRPIPPPPTSLHPQLPLPSRQSRHRFFFSYHTSVPRHLGLPISPSFLRSLPNFSNTIRASTFRINYPTKYPLNRLAHRCFVPLGYIRVYVKMITEFNRRESYANCRYTCCRVVSESRKRKWIVYIIGV